jgi:hypothetical protein
MPPEPRPAFYTLRTTRGHQATIYVTPDDDPWQAATQYARASIASDSQLAELRIASEAEIAALTAAFEKALFPGQAPSVPGSDTASPPPASPPADQPPRGAKVNVGRPGRKSTDHPVWATGLQQETWRINILVVWDSDLRRIVGLPANRAMGLLNYMRSTTAWKTDGIPVGAPDSYSLLDDPH